MLQQVEATREMCCMARYKAVECVEALNACSLTRRHKKLLLQQQQLEQNQQQPAATTGGVAAALGNKNRVITRHNIWLSKNGK